MERNPNIVKLSAFAPSLGNLNAYQWKPDLITFTAKPTDTVRSVSEYVRQIFNLYQGTHTLPVENTSGDFNPMFWVASIDAATNAVYLKVVNTLNATVPLQVDLDVGFATINGTIITNTNVSKGNDINDQQFVVPKPVKLPSNSVCASGSFFWTVPAFSITVLQFGV